ncbi:hypothetical protein [Alysiella filiformis]|uniref:Uncharacterized protein n=1 Tax=Alysiella filiformis DSM 16848 TaxID=1120981 RepID=A0A286EDR8_9NEIS|nr:hypothetical protein [Alysiella filiformis]QMT31693.1 hypothetical protein H3L97_01975 [Alysiella filiformis]UBQ55298.1 hypothetical protein JF568_06705 [Alysiella filiformis DSM 16848]SOD69052.1 hypothetical protein SAMN02746062_01505 [Alysiella filiformis DSM 16848]
MKKAYPIDKAVIIVKIKATVIHFVFSLLVFLAALAWIRWVLYPDFHFDLNGVWYGLRLIAGVDLVLGPLITLLVYHSAKPMREKVGDFAIAGVVQIIALSYGLHTMYQEHPRMIAFNDYGTAVTVTQREFGESSELPENLAEFDKLAGVPIAAIHPENGVTHYAKLDLSSLQKADEATRRTLNYEDDKQTLADLEKQHGKLYVFGVMGKYQGAFVAMDAAQNLIATFGQRDLH